MKSIFGASPEKKKTDIFEEPQEDPVVSKKWEEAFGKIQAAEFDFN